jgi:hypothetical protein
MKFNLICSLLFILFSTSCAKTPSEEAGENITRLASDLERVAEEVKNNVDVDKKFKDSPQDQQDYVADQIMSFIEPAADYGCLGAGIAAKEFQLSCEDTYISCKKSVVLPPPEQIKSALKTKIANLDLQNDQLVSCLKLVSSVMNIFSGVSCSTSNIELQTRANKVAALDGSEFNRCLKILQK